MDLNPFASFRKYQKFWMASILLLCMITFVLCTGGQQRGDLMDIINRVSGNRGKPVITVNGVGYTPDDVERLKSQRNVADAYMKHCFELAADNLHKIITAESKKEAKKGDERAQQQRDMFLGILGMVKQEFTQRVVRNRYFEGGVKTDELANFIMWRDEADRLGINLDNTSVLDIFDAIMLNNFMRDRFGRIVFSSRDSQQAFYDISRDHRLPSEDVLLNALRDEFRVRIAQLASMQSQTASFFERARLAQVGLKGWRGEYPLTIRAPLSAQQLWEKYESERSEFDVTVLPVPVEHFLPILEKKLAAEKDKKPDIAPPTDQELTTLFELYKNARFDPTSKTPGLEVPHRVKAAWVTADPSSKPYQQAASAALLFEAMPPVWSPLSSPLETLVRYTAGPAALDASLQRDYENHRKSNPLTYESLPIEEKGMLQHLLARTDSQKPSGNVIAQLTALSASNPVGAAVTYPVMLLQQHPELKDQAAAEDARRAKVYDEYALLAAQLAVSGATGPMTPRDPFVAAFIAPKLAKLLEEEKFLPLPLVREEIKQKRVDLTATAWAQENMKEVRETLEQVAGKQQAFESHLTKLIAKYNLEHGKTENYYHRYNIDKAPELKLLKEAFTGEHILDQINIIEGRAQKTEEALTKNDFSRLFFDGLLEFSAADERFRARPWPPVVQAKAALQTEPDAAPKSFDMFERANKPILFWKTEDKAAEIYPDLKAARTAVLDAWKFQTARDKLAIAYAQDVAEQLLKDNGDFLRMITTLEQGAEKVGRNLIPLDAISPLTKDRMHVGVWDYRQFKLPEESFSYPKEKMAQDILALHDLKKEIKTGNTQVDNLNKYLFKQVESIPEKNAQRFVQILVNQPETEFYVAAVMRKPEARFEDFLRAYQHSVGGNENNPLTWTDRFIEHAQLEFATKYRDDILKEMTRRYDTTIDKDLAKED